MKRRSKIARNSGLWCAVVTILALSGCDEVTAPQDARHGAMPLPISLAKVADESDAPNPEPDPEPQPALADARRVDTQESEVDAPTCDADTPPGQPNTAVQPTTKEIKGNEPTRVEEGQARLAMRSGL